MTGVPIVMGASWQGRIVLTLSLCLLSANSGYPNGQLQKRYPNELQGFRFYAKYLAPLRPGVSNKDAVRRVLGDTAPVKRNGWTLISTYTTKSGPVHNPTLGPLYQIIVRPDGVIPMGAVKFSAAFTHCHSSESETNISFDVYSDTFGLEYWLHQADSEWGKKGDLSRIIYGPRRRPDPPNTFCY